MNEVDVIAFTGKTLLLVMILSLPTILVATFVGTLVSLFQALTQIQEQTLSFAVKLIAVAVTLFFTASWTGGQLYQFAKTLFVGFPMMVR